MTSVVIAAHNEATVISECLTSLLADAQPHEFDVTVVANGCSDDTAAVAARHPGVRVLDIAVASKSAALNAGDAVAVGFPRIYLDADIVVNTRGARALSARVSPQQTGGSITHAPLAAVPRRQLVLDGRPLLVRGYFAINCRLPAFSNSLFGRGMIALSEPARSRFGHFPGMIADDLFLDSLFTDAEKLQVDEVTTRVETPRGTRELLRRLVRVRRGNAEMRHAARSGAISAEVRPADRWSWLRDVVVPHPWLAPAAIAYVGITGIAAVLAKRTPPQGKEWGHDVSSRVRPATAPSGESRAADE